ncbi:MAG: hypothetical protein V4489_00570 [Chlamydiota bacterium]
MHFFIFSLLSFNLLSPTLTLEVKPINEFSLQNLPSSLILKDSSLTMKGSYSITTNENNKKIIGCLSTPLPPHTTLTVHLEAPKGAHSLGKVLLSNQDTLLVSNISRVAEENLNITYILSSDTLPPAGSYSNLVRFTLTE